MLTFHFSDNVQICSTSTQKSPTQVIIEDENEKDEEDTNDVFLYDQSIPSKSHSTPLEKGATLKSKNLMVMRNLIN